ncbi:hypothetical protein QVD17_31360 [Tagetes erecta]|uniref:Secreted protein n=1 Tax=Tagetes erecta TaxID=13708 RepID=A0AAD8NNT1_TARER|nr:hypothetical protein QVD17_31360 [Tagetes erecta]
MICFSISQVISFVVCNTTASLTVCSALYSYYTTSCCSINLISGTNKLIIDLYIICGFSNYQEKREYRLGSWAGAYWAEVKP